MTIPLPPAIAGYFAADSSDDIATLLRTFTDDAVVVDEGNTHRAHGEIAAWKTQASTQYSYTVDPFAIHQDGDQITVTAHLAGNFPGSPLDLRYRFALRGDRIAALEIAP